MDAIEEEVKYLRELLTRRHRDPVTMAEVSGDCLRYLLACEQMQRVLDETKRLGTESPMRTATDFARAEEAKRDSLTPAARGDGDRRAKEGTK